MAKPNGKIIESPVKANFLEGLSVLEYFSSTHGARKGLSDTALKTADSGYLTRRLADVAQNCVVTMHDCGTTNGILKSVIKKGDSTIPLSQSIVGRVSCMAVVDPSNDEVIVNANELITIEAARKIDALGLEKLRVRSPMTCEAELGVCSLCYGMDLSTSRLVEEGMAVGIIAAQSIGEPGTQLTMRTFHIGGAASHSVEANETKTQYEGIIRFEKMDIVDNPSLGGKLVLNCRPDGGVLVCNKRGQYRERYHVAEGTILLVSEGDRVEVGQSIARVDPHSKLLIAKSAGIVKFSDLIEGDTVTVDYDPLTNKTTRSVSELKGERHPRLDVQSFDGASTNESYQLPSKTKIEVEDGSPVERGTILARMPQSASGSQDITNGLPRVTEIFEARSPKDPAVLAEVSGIVEISEKRSHRKKLVVVRTIPATPGDEVREVVHEIPQGKRILVFTGDEVQRGQALTEGQLVPKDILRIKGEEAVQDYLVQQVQEVYRSQAVGINDKHIEIVVSQMLRKVKVADGGDTSLLAGDVVDKFEFRRRNNDLNGCVKIKFPGDTDFNVGDIVPRDVFEAKNEKFVDAGGAAATCERPKAAHGQTQILGITKAAVQSDSFLSAASFQETTKVLTEAALAYKVDKLVGLKENVILGRLIPAGTGFHLYQKAHWDHQHGVQPISGPEGGELSFNQDLLDDVGDKLGVSVDVDGAFAFRPTGNQTAGGLNEENAVWNQDDFASEDQVFEQDDLGSITNNYDGGEFSDSFGGDSDEN